MENRKGIWIPIEIIEDDNLDWINKVLLSEIISYSKLPLGCIASNEKFGELLHIHRGNVSKRISYLVETEYIKINLVKKGENKSMRIIIPHKGVSDNAQRSKRKRSPNKTSIISVKKTFIETDISSDTNTDKIENDDWITNYFNEKQIK